MATRKNTRAAKAHSRSTLRRAEEEAYTKLVHDLMGARAATMTAILALEGKGVDGQVALSLRIHVLQALERIDSTVTGRAPR